MAGYGYLVSNTERPFWKKVTAKNFHLLKGGESKCAFCGTTEKLTIDHKLPKSKNPKARGLLANYQLMCWNCNMLKSNYKLPPETLR